MSNPQRTASAASYVVEIARRRGDGWSTWSIEPRLQPRVVQLWTAPKWHTASMWLSPRGGEYPLDVASVASIDDVVRIGRHERTDAGRPYLRTIFIGFIAENRTHADQRDATVEITANSMAWRLWRDVVVYGQDRRSFAQAADTETDAEITHYSGLRTQFNPDGRPNRDPRMFVSEDDVPLTGPLFCTPGAPGALYWTADTALAWLQAAFNREQTWIVNHAFDLTADSAQPPLFLPDDLTGQRLWNALARVAAAGRCDVFEQFVQPDGDDATEAFAQIVVRPIGSGDEIRIAMQAPGRQGAPPELDMRKTNLYSTTIRVDAASCVTSPTVAGGRPLVELAVELSPAWNADDVDADIELSQHTPPTEAEMVNDAYAQQYVVGGSQFKRTVGRWWRANTDGAFDDETVAIVDMAELAGETAGSWPLGRYAPLALLPDRAGETAPAYAEVSFDAGQTWTKLANAGVEIADDDLAIWIGQADLREIVDPADSSETFWMRLADMATAAEGQTPPGVKVRLVCCVAGPTRAIARPNRREGAGTVFAHTAWVDRGAAWQVRTRAASSPRAAELGETGTSDGSAGEVTIDDDAAWIQAQAETRLIAADLPLELPDESIELGSVVRRIEGAEIELASNAGSATRYPRVIGIRLNLINATQHLVLDHDREAPVR